MRIRTPLTIILTIVLAVLLPLTAAADVKIGVLAKRGAPKCMQQWGATGAYLGAALGETVKIIPLKFEAIGPAVENGMVDFVLANSAFYVELQKTHGLDAVATLVNSRGGKALDSFGGVLFTRADSPVKTLADVKGRSLMCVKRSSFGGAHMAWRLLKENGVDPETDCSEFIEGGKHDNVVLAVLNGTVDVGTVRSDTIERMADEGKIDTSQLRLIHAVDDGFPFVHSTCLYPEWPLAKLPGTDAGLAGRVAEALIAMTSDETAAQNAKIVGWKAPADYAPVQECLTVIGYGAFGKE